MIIPNKYSGYQAGIRLYPGDGGGAGGDGGTGDAGSAAGGGVGPGAAGGGDAGFGGSAGTGGGGGGGDGGGSGNSYVPPTTNNAGNTGTVGGNQITSWNTTPVNRQPVYQPQYQNYANPYTAFNVSQYGQQPSYGGGFSGMGGLGSLLSQAFGGQTPFSYQQPAQQTQPQMNWQTGQMMQPAQPAQQAPFNPYTNSFGGGFGGFGGGYGGGFGGGFDSGYGGFMPQMQSPYSYQQPMQQAQPTQQNPLSSIGRAIVGRSSQMRGTPNVMRRAEGGIMSLMDDE